MTKFKKGDRVRVLPNWGYDDDSTGVSIYAGIVGVVSDLPGPNDPLYMVDVEEDPEGTTSGLGHLPCLESELEPDDAA